MVTTDSLERGTIVRNVKTATLFYVCRLREVSESGDPVYIVESRRDGKRFGRVRYLKGSQMEVVASE